MSTSLSLELSRAHYNEAARHIAGGVNSNVRLPGNSTALCFSEARGAYLIDVDGNRYIDYALGMGPTILGHAPKVVTEAVARSLVDGQLFAGQSRAELELARRLRQYIPGAGLVRIGMTGSEMVQAALRVARAATGRNKFVKFSGHYHGWFDNVLTQEVTFPGDRSPGINRATPSSRGQTPQSLAETVVLRWNDLASLTDYLQLNGNDTAAVIMELVMCNTGVIRAAPGYLEGVRRLCDKYGVVLITDEVVTGFRLGLSGAQGALGVTGDLGIFAKALGGGFPIAALTGRESLMSLIGSGAVNHSGTYNSNAIAVSAAIATLDALAADNAAAYRRIESIGQMLIDGIRAVAKETGHHLIVQGYPSVFNTSFGTRETIDSLEDYRQCDLAKQQQFLGALLTRGIRPTSRGTWFVSAAHTETDVHDTIAAVRDALETCE